MRAEDAEKVIGILLECDGGCEYCASRLLKLFGDRFPEHRVLAATAFKNKFGASLEDFLGSQDISHKTRPATE